MGNDVLSLRQLVVWMAVALLGPAADLLPGLSARQAGGAGWLAPLGALLLLLPALWLCAGLCREGNGLAGAIQGALGRSGGNALLIIYMVWALALLSGQVQMCAARLAMVYGRGPAFACAAALLGLAVWMAWGKTSAFARAGEIFYLALAVALAGILILAASKIEPGNLMPAPTELLALPGASAWLAGVLLWCVPGAFLARKVKPARGDGGRAAGWTVGLCITVCLLLCAVIGNAGPRLTARLPAPFLTAVQGLGIKGAFERMEALTAALWCLSDFMFFGLQLMAWRELGGALRPGGWTRWSLIPAAGLALCAAWLFCSGQGGIPQCTESVLALSGLVLGLLIPGAVRLIQAVRK